MIDHLMAFVDEAAARADSVVGAYWHSDGKGGGSWDLSCCIPGIFVWAPANDTTSQVTGPGGQQVNVVTHHACDGLWRMNIALPSKSSALAASSACHLIADRGAAIAGQPFILQSVLNDVQLATLMLQPMFVGSNYPFGAPQ
jgi:hypothetical protein